MEKSERKTEKEDLREVSYLCLSFSSYAQRRLYCTGCSSTDLRKAVMRTREKQYLPLSIYLFVTFLAASDPSLLHPCYLFRLQAAALALQ